MAYERKRETQVLRASEEENEKYRGSLADPRDHLWALKKVKMRASELVVR